MAFEARTALYLPPKRAKNGGKGEEKAALFAARLMDQAIVRAERQQHTGRAPRLSGPAPKAPSQRSGSQGSVSAAPLPRPCLRTPVRGAAPGAHAQSCLTHPLCGSPVSSP